MGSLSSPYRSPSFYPIPQPISRVESLYSPNSARVCNRGRKWFRCARATQWHSPFITALFRASGEPIASIFGMVSVACDRDTDIPLESYSTMPSRE